MMKEILSGIVGKNFMKRKSIPYAAGLGIATFFALFWGNDVLGKDNPQQYCIALGSFMVLAFATYSILCLVKDRLPCAPRGSIGVLFEIDAETDDIYNTVCYNLAHQVDEFLRIPDSPQLKVICVPSEKVAKYKDNAGNKMVNLLVKTNCIIHIMLKCKVDSVTQTEKYEMTLNYGILHPNFSQDAENILLADMKALKRPIGKLKFNRDGRIDIFNFTAQSLSYICQYVLGMVYLLALDYNNAYSTFTQLKEVLAEAPKNVQLNCILDVLVEIRLFSVYIQMANNNIYQFEQTQELAYLRLAKDLLESANQIVANTYDYYVKMAYVCIALDQDEVRAREYINKCKSTKYDYSWKYSDAFLSAYSDHAPMTICAKYKQAFQLCDYNLINLISYIEFIISIRPEKAALHLAAGLVYERIGDAKQMNRHFQRYLVMSEASKNGRIEKELTEKMKRLPCNEKCNNDCIHCDETATSV